MIQAKRIAYIDAMRGFTMFLVVFWHVMALSFGITSKDSTLGTFCLTFRMPMFFFISGFLGYKAIESFDREKFFSMVKKKSFVQLVPTFIFFSFFHLVHNSSPFVYFTEGLTGYWFTLVLYELFITLYINLFIINKLGGGKRMLGVMLILYAIIGNIMALYINTRHPMPRISIVLTLNNYFYYLQFFVLGCFFKASPKFMEKMTGYKTFTVVTVLFFLVFLAENKWLTHDFNRFIYYALDSVVIRYLGLLMIYNVFAMSAEYFAQNGRLSRVMQFAGSRTLDIYLLHYFFLPTLVAYKTFFVSDVSEMVIGELFIQGAIAIGIMALCLLVSSCLRKSPILAKYLFGILPKKK